MRRELLLNRCLAPGDQGVVVADADDLDDSVEEAVVRGHHGGRKLDGRRFPLGVRGVGIGDVPLGGAVDPDVQTMRAHRLDHRWRDVRWDRPFVDDRHVGEDDDPAVEGGHRHRHAERLDQHPHAARRTSARDREQHPTFLQPLHRLNGAWGQHLVLRDEGAVDVCQHRGNRLVG